MADSHQDEIAKLEALFASNPGGRVFTHLAEAYRKAGNLDRAREIAEDGLRRHDGYASAHVVMGRIFLDMGRRDEAASEFRRVLQLDPENRIALRGLGDYERERGSAQEALRHYRQLQQLDPGDEELSATMAELDRGTAAPAAPSPPPAAAAPGMDYFGSFSNEPYGAPPASAPSQQASQGGGYDSAPGSGELNGYGRSPAHDQGAGEVGTPPGETTGTSPDEFEPLPLSLDWTGAGATDAGGESPDLRLDWDIGAGDEVVGSAGPAETAAEPVRDAPGSDFHLELPGPGPAAEDPAAAWRELEEAASAALPAADQPALPSGEHEALLSGEHEALPSGEHEALPPPARESGVEFDDLGSVTYEWQEPGGEPGGSPPVAEHASGPAGERAFAPDEEDALATDLPTAAETEVYTETLAELYRAQGFRERAIGVYRALLADRPGDERLLMKLRELEGVTLDETAPTEAVDPWQALADSMAQGTQRDPTAEEEPGGGAAAGADAAAETERPEPEWVESVESAWTGGSGAAGTGDGLYTPPVEEADADHGGVPVAQALSALLDWKPTRRPAADPEEELLLLDEVADDAEGEDLVGRADASSEWDGSEDFASEAATGPRTFETRAAAEPLPWDPPEPRTESESAAAAAAESLPWDPPEPRTESDSATAAAAEPLPWDPPEPRTESDSAAAAAAESLPWDPPERRTESESSGATGEGSLPWEAAAEPADEKAAAPGPGDVGNPFDADARSSSRPAGSEESEDDEDDDDLEMFRSWLQSLRR